MARDTPRVPPEAVKAAVSATRSTDAWCELALAAALPHIFSSLLTPEAIEAAVAVLEGIVESDLDGRSATDDARAVIQAAIQAVSGGGE